MPSKRKSAATTTDEPAPKKRSTRASASSSSTAKAPAAPKAKAAPAAKSKTKAKGKSKKEEIVLSESDDNGSSSDVVIEEPVKKKKKAAAPSKAKKETKTPVKKSKAAAAALEPVDADDKDSTSTPTDSAPKKKSPVKAKVEKKKSAKKVPFEEAFPAWFAQFAEEEDAETMGGEGIEKLFEEMDVSMEGVLPFVLAWKVKAAPGTFGSFSKKDFEAAFKPQKIDSSDKLKAELVSLEKLLYAPVEPVAADPQYDNDDESDAVYQPDSDPLFRQFYAFLFPFLKNEGAKTVPPEIALAMLSVALAPKFELGKAFTEFATAQGDNFKAMSLDSWTQLYGFCRTVKPDLTGWSEDDAWPSIIDAFVGWKKEQDASTTSA
ncbi:hypothetical protein JCM8547_002919 [Rhodosporidiobolus lusitaniae]